MEKQIKHITKDNYLLEIDIDTAKYFSITGCL